MTDSITAYNIIFYNILHNYLKVHFRRRKKLTIKCILIYIYMYIDIQLLLNNITAISQRAVAIYANLKVLCS